MEKDINIRYSKIVKQYERNKYISMENYIKTTLQIKDKNIKILEKCEEEYIKNVKTLVYYGNLTYTPHHCINCGCKNKNNSIVKNGYRISSTLILPSISSLPAILRLKKQRFLCRECNSTFVAETDLVNKKCRITNRIKRVILCDLTETLSLNAIARRNNVSVNTVVKISNIGNKGVVNYNYLPEYLCFDEFSSTNDVNASMSFIFCDSISHKIIDIVEDRRLRTLIEYFLKFPYKVRARVKTIVIDMNKPYMKLIQQMFPNALIIIDRFHIVQAVNREFTKQRIKSMNNLLNKNPKAYRRIKKYCKLLVKDRNDLSNKYVYYPLFKEQMSQSDVVNTLLSYDEELKAIYYIVQELREELSKNDSKKFFDIIKENYTFMTKAFKRIFRTFKSIEGYIRNTCTYPKFTNGPLEGINNKIKLILFKTTSSVA